VKAQPSRDDRREGGLGKDAIDRPLRGSWQEGGDKREVNQGAKNGLDGARNGPLTRGEKVRTILQNAVESRNGTHNDYGWP